MRELTKTPPIDNGPRVLVISCPEVKYASVLEFLRQNDCKVNEENDTSDSIPYPESSPGTVLRGLRCRDALTQVDLSRLAGIPRRHISEMENGKRPIGRQNARKLAAAFNTDPRMFLFA